MSTRSRYLLAASLLGLVVLLMPTPSYAATNRATFLGPIVPDVCKCTDQTVQGTSQKVATAPDFGCVLQVTENSINFAITLSSFIFLIYLVITGLSFITSGGSSESLSKAKTRFMNVFIGLAVLLCAWLIIDFVLKKLYDQGSFGPWNAILAGDTSGKDRCIVSKNPVGLTSGTYDIIFGDVTGSTIAGGASGSTGLSPSTAAQYAIAHARSSSGGQCALYVRQALAAGGLTSFNADHPPYAYQYDPFLTKAGFTAVKSGTYSKELEGNIQGLRAGDVVVFQKVPGHIAGHIAIFTGSQWVSDYVQNTMSSNPSDYTGGAYTIYRP